MPFVNVIGLFDNPGAVERAESALFDAGLASNELMHVEPDPPLRDSQNAGLLERVKQDLEEPSTDLADIFPEDVPPGTLVLLATVPVHDADEVEQIMRRQGAFRTQVRADRFAPPVAEEPDDTPKVCIDAAPDQALASNDEALPVRLFDEDTGREIGRISEAELAVLQDALEEEDPDDRDYWINPDTVNMLACRPGAAPHLIALLRAAVGDNEDGMDIAFQRAGEPLQSLRGARAAEPPADSSPAADEEIQKAVLAELNGDPRIEASRIGVSVNDGVVTLSGEASSYVETLMAEKTAKRVRGVRAVANQLKVKLPDQNHLTDEAIAEAAVRALRWNLLVPSNKIKVIVSEGRVTLEGSLRWRFQKEAAAHAVSRLPGVSRVEDRIAIEP